MLQRKQDISKEEDGIVDDAPHIIEEFSVLNELTGLVIGKRGSNLSAARNINGIKNIELDENRSNSHCFVKVFIFFYEN